jgi:large subunit ribosomal protein L10
MCSEVFFVMRLGDLRLAAVDPFVLRGGGETMARPDKVAMVAEIQERLSKSQGTVLTDYRGINAGDMTALRKELREAGVEYKVFKNTLTILAAQELQMDGLVPFLNGPTAFAFGYNDPVAPAKILSEFAKKNKALEIKAGIVEGKIVGPEGVANLADLPSREVLLSMVVRGMQGPISGMVNVLQGNIRNLVYALEAIREQKEASA